MKDIVGWFYVAMVAGMGPGLIVFAIVRTMSKKTVEEKYEGTGGGFGGAFDAIWMPSAYEAGMERDRQTRRTAPAPSPGDPPNAIDGDRIVIDI
ncbi:MULTISPECIES: hypothetical protein [Microbacterium]|uniref:hypothetical protein n=1 Tax=Microbacterium TaxID=33882 RepID=UPI000CFD14DE|nr:MULTISPECIES: hypothetical protein [unclassified Microbacterium]PRB11425.1 hypothetical protein CQ047_04095 [Microbacterium sp. MYb72]